MMRLAFYRVDAPKKDKFDYLVNLATGRYGYSHIELVFSSGASFSASPREGSCRFKDINIDDTQTWVVLELDQKIYNSEFEAEAWREAVRLNGKEYDWAGIFLNQALPFGIDNKDKWWCSEVAMWLLRCDPFKVSPNEVAIKFGVPSLEDIIRAGG
jgi:hypothetical protein